MPVTIYKSTDAGAPAKPSTGADGAKYIMDILKACLVDGYSGKTAAGWTLDYQDTTVDKERLALSNGNGVIEFVRHRNNHLMFMLWDSITTPGVGAFYDDAFNDVMSDGVNGVKHELRPLPGTASEALPALYTWYMYQDTQYDWVIYANDKAAVMRFHYPQGHASADAGDSLTYNSSYNPMLLFGAVQSPEMARDALGNFFLGYGGYFAPSVASGNTSAQQYMTHFIGLRTPMGTVPDYAANSPKFNVTTIEPYYYNHNPHTPLRQLTHLEMSYIGGDVPKPASWSSTSQADFTFAYLPGAVCVAKDGGNNNGFWGNWSAEQGWTWNQEVATLGTLNIFPSSLVVSSNPGTGITDDAAWWP